MRFTGIPTAACDFYEDLEADNSRAFWLANKAAYDEVVRAPVEALAAELSENFGPPKLFRPYRDVRFSVDKTPYKTHQGVWFAQTSVYFHISAAGLFLAAGYWRTAPDQVARMRTAVATERTGTALERAITTITGKGFTIGGDQLKRVPAGVPKDHPRAELLRHKTLTAHQEIGTPTWLVTPRACAEITALWQVMAPLTSWLDEHVGPPRD